MGQPVVRDLLGVVLKFNATKGGVVSSTNYTKPARQFINGHSNIELIGHTELPNLLNKYLGTNWPFTIDKILMREKNSTF